MTNPAWIAADWGTSNLRLWAIGPNSEVLGERTSDKGMGGLRPEDFEPALKEAAGDWLNHTQDVMACGMVGSRQGWVEAPYQTTPCKVCPGKMVTAPTTSGLRVHVIPGIRQMSPPDVMRGEETQIAGFLAQHDDWDGVICLPGTHTKWVHVSAGEVVSFQTFMTGEMFAILSDNSVLRHSVSGAGWDDAAFLDAVDTIMSKPETLAARLFSLRADELVHGTGKAALRSRLSGLLIGAEIAAAKPYWLGQRLALVGADAITGPYLAALTAQGAQADKADATAMTLAGLMAAHTRLETA